MRQNTNLTFVIDSRMQEATTHTPRTVTTHEEPADWPHKRLLATRILNLAIFSIIILNHAK